MQCLIFHEQLLFRIALIFLKIIGWLIFCILFIPIVLFIAPHTIKKAMFHNTADAHKGFEPRDYDMNGRNFYLRSGHSLIPIWHLYLPPIYTSSEADSLLYANNTKILLYVHGNSVDRISSAPSLTKFVNCGWQVLAFDYSGYAENAAGTLGFLPPEELMIVHRWLKQKAGNNNIFWWCYSIGTGICSTTAVSMSSEGISPSGLILESAFSSIRDLLHSLILPDILISWLPILGDAVHSKYYRLFGGDYNVLVNLKRLSKIPILHLHSEDDLMIHISHFDRIKKAMEREVGVGFLLAEQECSLNLRTLQGLTRVRTCDQLPQCSRTDKPTRYILLQHYFESNQLILEIEIS